MVFQLAISTLSFRQWLFQDRENKHILWFAVCITVVTFIWIKGLYPYPNFMPPDSNSYLEAAFNNDFINIWAIGYSKFLRLLSCFSTSHLFLVIFQYLLLQACLLYFLYSIRYLLTPGKWLGRILLAISFFNPLLPHISNFVSSDCLFLALSLIWFTQLLWIIYTPTKYLLLLHAVVLLLAFMVRHQALYYPFISFSIIIINTMPKLNKWIGLAAISTLLLIYIGYTRYEYHKKTDIFQYSAFGSWQIAANALYGYAHSKPDKLESVPNEFRNLHIIVNRHMDSIRHLAVRPDREIGVYYLWDYKSPLRLYMEQKWRLDTTTAFFKKWASMAPLYAAYGRFLITKHPEQFSKYFLWQNLKRFYAPPSYFMGIYNMGNSTVKPIAVEWFDWKNNILKTNTKSKQIEVANLFIILSPILNFIFIAGLIAFLSLGGLRKCKKPINQIIVCTLALWIGNFVFSVVSAPIELRYQLFPTIINLSWAILFIGHIIDVAFNTGKTNPKILISLPEKIVYNK